MAQIQELRLSADGCVPFASYDDVDCCPPPLCGNDLCCTFIAAFNLLPSGPLWDYWKAAAISYFERSDDPASCPLLQDPRCPSLVLHMIYAVLKLRRYVHDGLWPALRESHPATAVTTLDNHLARMRWEDCYASHCRTVLGGELTPYEVWTDCGPLFCPPDFPPELEDAVKKAVATALTRANMGVIKNLCSINWVVEPLGAEIVPIYPPSEPVQPIEPEPCTKSMCAEGIAFEIRPTRDWLEGTTTELCTTQEPPPRVPAFWDRPCDSPAGLPFRIYPGVLAAECIIRSMMPPTCPSNITRAC